MGLKKNVNKGYKMFKKKESCLEQQIVLLTVADTNAGLVIENS